MTGPAPRTALVTGASRGIGRAIAERLAADGWTVLALSRSVPKEPFPSTNIRHHAVDVADEAAVLALFEQLKQTETTLGGLVNSAAIQGGKSIREQSRDEWREMLEVNLTGAWQMIKSALPLMADGGAIVNVGSVASVAGFAERSAYCASKHALLGLTKSLAAELAADGIRVNHLCLGSFDTPGLQQLASAKGSEASAYASRQLLNRLGEPEEAAAACAFLLSEEAGFITGSSLTVDGGLLTKGAFG